MPLPESRQGSEDAECGAINPVPQGRTARSPQRSAGKRMCTLIYVIWMYMERMKRI